MAFNAGELVATLRADLGGFARDMATAQAGLKQTGAAAVDAGKKADAAGQQTAAAAKTSAAAAKQSGAAGKQAGAAAAAGAKEATAAAKQQGTAAREAGDAAAAAGRKASSAQDELAKRTKAAAEQTAKQMEASKKVGEAVTGFGVAALAGFGLAVKASSDFEDRMAQVRSLTHGNADEMAAMRDAALSMGSAYGMSANDVADAQIELTKAGQSLEEQLNGGLAGALTLAAAGQMDVGEATSIATTAMTQFHLSAKDTSHVADLLAAGADKALGSVGDLGMGLKQGGLVASQFGMSIDETTGTLAMFANNGLMGSDAGTSLKTMLLSLANPSKQAAAALKAAGVNAYDAQGKFVGMQNLAGQLATGMGTYSDSARQAALATIFGTDAIRAGSILFNSGAAEVGKWTNGMDSAGFAAEQAAGKTDSLAGDTQKLSAALQNDLIRAGDAVAPMMRVLTQGATGLAAGFAEIDPTVLGVGTALTGVGGAALTAGGGFLLLLPRIVETRAAMATLAAGEVPVLSKAVRGIVASSSAAAGGLARVSSFLIGPWGLALAAAGAGLAAYQMAVESAKASTDTIQAAAERGASGIDVLIEAASRGQNVQRGWAAFLGGQDLDLQAGVLKDLTGQLRQMADMRVNPLEAFFAGNAQLGATSETLGTIGTQLAKLAATDAPAAGASFQAVAAKTDGSRAALVELLDRMPEYAAALEAQATKQGLLTGKESDAERATVLLAQASTDARIAGDSQASTAEDQAAAISDIQGNAASATADVKALADAIEGLGSSTLDERAAARDMQDAIDKASKAVRTNKHTLDDSTEAGRANNAALDDIVKTTLHSAAASEKAGGSYKEITGIVKEGRAAFIRNATAILGSSTAAERLADKLHLIPKDVAALVHVTTEGTKNLSDAKTYIQWLRDHSVTNMVVTASGTAGGKNQATGGEVVGPGPKGIDSVPTMLAPGEHVLTTADVDRMGGQSQVYAFRSALQNGDVQHFASGGAVSKKPTHKPAPKKAPAKKAPAKKAPAKAAPKRNSGAVSDADQKAERYKTQAANAQRALTAAARRQRDAERAATRAAAAYKKAADHAASIYGKGTANEKHAAELHARALKRTADRAAKAAKDDAAEVTKQTKTRDDAKQHEKDQRTRAAALRQSDEDLSIANVRGQYIDASNPLGAVDFALQESRDPNLTAGQRKTLDTLAKTQNKTLQDLSDQAADAANSVDSATTALDNATTAAGNSATQLQALKDSASQLASTVASTVRGFFGLGNTLSADVTTADVVTPDTVKAVTHNAGTAAQWDEQVTIPGSTTPGTTTRGSTTVATIRSSVFSSGQAMQTFADDLSRLRAMGYSTEVVTDVANLGVDQGSRVADALLAGTGDDVAAINSGYQWMGSASGAAGQTIASATYDSQIAAQQAAVDAANQQVTLAQQTLDADKAHAAAIQQSILDAQTRIVEAVEKAFSGSSTVKHAFGAYQPQIQPAGANVLWAEHDTGGEAYIPFALDRRPRALAILSQTAQRLGQTVVPAGATRYAGGGISGSSSSFDGSSVNHFHGPWFGTPDQVLAAAERRSASKKARAYRANGLGRVNP